MDLTTINVLLTTFPGLNLPRTLALHLPSTSTLADVHERIASYLPISINPHNLLLTTTASKQLLSSTTQPLSTVLTAKNASFLPLQLRPRLLGGKGGFGSQLRADGGKMSSKKQRSRPLVRNSNRAENGAKVWIVEQGEALKKYLVEKPGVERREREERRKRLERILDEVERREKEVKEGRAAAGDASWKEEKEELEERVRVELKRSLAEGKGEVGRESDESGAGSESERDAVGDASASGSDEKGKGKTVFGWDDEDEDMSDESEDSDDES